MAQVSPFLPSSYPAAALPQVQPLPPLVGQSIASGQFLECARAPDRQLQLARPGPPLAKEVAPEGRRTVHD